MNLIDQFPKHRLSREDEARLLKTNPERVALHTMREALLYTQRVCRNRIPEDERASLCYRKLMMCAKRFLPGGIRFFAFSKAGLRGAILDYWTAKKSIRNAKEIVSADWLGGWDGPVKVRGMVVPKAALNHRINLLPTEEDSGKDDTSSRRELVTGEISQPDIEGICIRDQWAEIEKLVAPKLNDRQRMILSLVYQSGLNFPQIAKRLDVTRSLIHAIHRDTLIQIRNIISDDGRLLEE
jgi:RNA polymerase sigma factor (sigma-70 family)